MDEQLINSLSKPEDKSDAVILNEPDQGSTQVKSDPETVIELNKGSDEMKFEPHSLNDLNKESEEGKSGSKPVNELNKGSEEKKFNPKPVNELNGSEEVKSDPKPVNELNKGSEEVKFNPEFNKFNKGSEEKSELHPLDDKNKVSEDMKSNIKSVSELMKGLEKLKFDPKSSKELMKGLEKLKFDPKRSKEPSKGLEEAKDDPETKTPLGVAKNYKNKGNCHFIDKEYEMAAKCFTEGIKSNCSDQTINAQLYNNRSAANFHLQNFRTALMDCETAIKLKPDYLKAIERGIKCAIKLKAWNKVYYLRNIKSDLDTKMKTDFEEKRNAGTEQENQEKDIFRKRTALLLDQLKINSLLVEEIKSRGIKIFSSEEENVDANNPFYLVKELKPQWGTKVFLNDDKELVWPVLFTYPEYNEMSITEFNENDRFIDHLTKIFGPTAVNPWDVERKYIHENLLMFYKMYSEDKVILIDSNSTLKNVSNDVKLEVKYGTPKFIIIVKESKYAENFCVKFGIKL